MSSQPARSLDPDAARPAEVVAGFLAAFAIAADLFALAWHPLRLVPIALLLSLVASGIGGRWRTLALASVLIGAVCFALAMAISVVTNRPLW